MRVLLLAVVALQIAPDHPLPLFPVGKLKKTDRCFDLAIEGAGFFQVSNGGTLYYTRNGNFRLNRENQLATRDGFLLDPPITVPNDALAVSVRIDGVVGVIQGGSTQVQQLGHIQLAMFRNPLGLHRTSKDLYRPTDDSDTPLLGNPGELHLGRIRQGYIEKLPKVKLDEDD